MPKLLHVLLEPLEVYIALHDHDPIEQNIEDSAHEDRTKAGGGVTVDKIKHRLYERGGTSTYIGSKVPMIQDELRSGSSGRELWGITSRRLPSLYSQRLTLNPLV